MRYVVLEELREANIMMPWEGEFEVTLERREVTSGAAERSRTRVEGSGAS
jgi:hypothetical protein